MQRHGREALKRVITRAKKHPLYRNRLKGFSPGSPLERLPLTSREDIVRLQRRGNPLRESVVGKLDKLSFIGRTGGPGAEAAGARSVIVPMRASNLRALGSIASRAFLRAGSPMRPTAMLEEISRNVVHQGLLRGLVLAGCLPVQLGRGFTLRHVLYTLPRIRPAQIVTYPTYAFFLKEIIDEQTEAVRREVETISPKRLFLWGEIGASVPAVREKLSELWNGAEVYDVYACQELGVLASECSEHTALHGFEDMFAYEVVDPHTGERLQEGEIGELVVTPLFPLTIPLLRYRTGDLTALKRGCSCGRDHVLLDGIRGRVSDFLAISSDEGPVYTSSIEEAVFGNPYLTGRYRILPDESVVEIEAKELNGTAQLHIAEFGWPPVAYRIKKALPRFNHLTRRMADINYDSILKEQERLEN